MIPGTWMCILYIGHTDSGIADPVVDHCIHWYCHAVFGQHLFIIVQIFFIPFTHDFTSWGGTPNVMVRRSTLWYDSMQGRMKNIPIKVTFQEPRKVE